jgi:GABA(A) receptor-associated protein
MYDHTQQPHKIPVRCQRSPDSRLPVLVRTNWMVPSHVTMGEFLFWIRRQLQLPCHMAMFMAFEDGFMPQMSATMSLLHLWGAGPDGCLHLVYSGENVFG